ncbi:acetyl-CoA carboxylase biotin carboxyl carrier protein [Oscillospiraceae bacterium PP1C4]
MSREFTIEQLQTLMKSVAENDIGELLFECEGVKLKIKGKTFEKQAALVPTPAPTMIASVSSVQSEAQICCPADTSKLITSPIVGTFYASSAPDKDAFAKIGQTVKKGDTVFIIESMKVMNEVSAEMDGVITEILVENGQSVEFGQPILRLE